MAPGKGVVDKLKMSRLSSGQLPEGRAVELFTLTNAQGVEVRAINYGGIIVSLKVPDRKGRLDDVVLGYDDVQGYLRNVSYFGAIIGRHANRIAKGRFDIDGKSRNSSPTMVRITCMEVATASTSGSGTPRDSRRREELG